MFASECEGAPRFAQDALVDLGFLIHSHSKLASKNHLPPLVLVIPKLEIFTGLGFHVALVYSSFRVYDLSCSGFKWTLIESFGIFLGRGCTITCNGAIAHNFAI